MGSSTYILNSGSSTNAIDIETTGFGCFGVHNGVATVCQYLDDLQPGRWSGPWDNNSGVHIQTDPNTDPDNSWDMDSGYFECTVNKTDNTITYSSTSARPPTGADALLAVPRSDTKTKLRPTKGQCACAN